VEADSKTALVMYNRAREVEGQELEDRAKAQTERLMEDKAERQPKNTRKRGWGTWSHGS